MFNTLWYTKRLEEVGVSRKQAEVHVQILADVIEEKLATKEDLKNLEYRLTIKGGAFGITLTGIFIAAVALLIKL